MRAVLWDLDGTLVDSEATHDVSLLDVLRAAGHDWPEDVGPLLVGISMAETHALLVDRVGLALDYDTFVARRQDAYLARAPGIGWRAGAREALAWVEAAGLAWDIVSNSDRVLVDANLRAAGLLRPHLVSVSRNDVRQGKPDAEPYLRAAFLLGIDPVDCVVVEDSPTGAAAGIAAGMTVLAWPEPHRGDLRFPAGVRHAEPHDLLATLRQLQRASATAAA